MIDADTLDWEKMDGLIPAIVQNRTDGQVRMLGYMNRAALTATLQTGFVTFYSRSKQRMWMKGEQSGNRLWLLDARADCDGDAILFLVDAEGPTCHLETSSCFGDCKPQRHFLDELEMRLVSRQSADPTDSYTARLHAQGPKRIAQKVGEEAVEVALAAVAGDRDELVNEAADLAYHLTVLLTSMGLGWSDVGLKLAERHERKAQIA